MTITTRALALAAILLGGLIDASAQDRMPPIPLDKMTDAQKKAVANYKELRGADLTGPPWSVILRVPDLVVPSLQIRLHNQRNSALSPKLTEFAILIAARQWTNNYEWSAHVTAAGKAGLGQPGAVEAASLEGYYTFLSMIMNTARSPLAPGTRPALAPFPK